MRNITEKKKKEKMELEAERNKQLIEFWKIVQKLREIQIQINKIKCRILENRSKIKRNTNKNK